MVAGVVLGRKVSNFQVMILSSGNPISIRALEVNFRHNINSRPLTCLVS